MSWSRPTAHAGAADAVRHEYLRNLKTKKVRYTMNGTLTVKVIYTRVISCPNERDSFHSAPNQRLSETQKIIGIWNCFRVLRSFENSIREEKGTAY